jgi:hypothetical protein
MADLACIVLIKNKLCVLSGSLARFTRKQHISSRNDRKEVCKARKELRTEKSINIEQHRHHKQCGLMV